jgi:hypothetical protein
MPNCATHPRRSAGRSEVPVFPIKAAKGEIPFTSLEISHSWNRDTLQPRNYSDGYQRFHPKQLDRTKNMVSEINAAIADKEAQLSNLRALYNKVVESQGKFGIETRVLANLSRKIDAVFAADMQGAIGANDLASMEYLISEVKNDPLLGMMIKRSTNVEQIEAKKENSVSSQENSVSFSMG